MIPYIVGFG